MVHVRKIIILFLLAFAYAPGLCRSSNSRQNQENEIGKIKSDLTMLKDIGVLLMKSHVSRLKYRLNNLKDELDLQEKTIDADKKDEKVLPLSPNDTKLELDRLVFLSNSLNKEINSLESKKVGEEKKVPLDSIVKNIENQEFDEAEKLLLQVDYKMKIPLIINQLYVDDGNDFPFLLKFAEKLRNIQLTHLVLVALLRAASANIDGNKQGQMIRTIHDQILNQANASEKQKQNARQLLREICVEEMLQHIIREKSMSPPFEDSLSPAASSLSPSSHCELSDDIVHLVIDDLSMRMTSDDLFKTIYRSKKFPNTIAAISYAYTKMAEWKMLGSMNMALFELTNYFWNLRNKFSITYPERNQMKVFPRSLQTLYFASKRICFKNVEYDEYLYVGDEKFDNQRRYALSWTPGNRDMTCLWSAEKSNSTSDDDSANVFIFRSVAHEGEYLFAAVYNFDTLYRQVFTWIPGGSADTDKQGKFAMEIHGDAIAMRSLHFGHYICATDQMLKPYKRHVLSSNSGPAEKRACQWILEDCNDL